MRVRPSAALLLVLLACGGSSAGSGTGSDAGQGATSCPAGDVACAAFVAAHDAARAAAQPAPSPPLPPVGWSGTAAQAAATWAARCIWVHDPALQTQGFGQNLYASTSEPTPAAAVTSWASEAPDYDYASNTCAAGKVCGHYTQVVWRGSTGIGCVTQRCTSGSPFGPTNGGLWWNVVCDYAPPGNWVGQRPY